MIGPVDHIGLAARRIEDAVDRFRAFGLELESIVDISSEGVRAAFLGAGPVRVEILESLRPDSAIAKFLERRGEGLHHVAFQTTDIVSEMRRLESEGFALIDREPRIGAHGRRVAFIHPKSAHGVLLELVEQPHST